jgi:hypothetical protein
VYRQADQRATTPPVVLRYRTYLTRIRVPLIAALLFALSIFFVGCIHGTHLVCTKAADTGHGQCSSMSYSGIGIHSETITIDRGDDLNVKLERGSKGSKWAIVTLRTKAMGPVGIGNGSLTANRFDPDIAYAASARFETFQKTASATTLDVWLRESVGINIVLVVLGCVFLAIVTAMIRETVMQRRWIKIVIDHDRRMVGIGGQEVGFDEIRLVGVDSGKALFWASGKNEHIPGYRVFVELMDGIRVFAHKDYRAGKGNTAAQEHDAIKTRLAREIGLHLRGHEPGKPIGVAGGARKKKKKNR